jgi:hypothetical protein
LPSGPYLATQETAWPPELSTRKAARRKKLLSAIRIGLADLRELSTGSRRRNA